jgi:superfamily II DNA or RNA helicase
MYTDYHAKYYAHALTRKSSADDPDKLSASLVNATVDLNPHQIDAAIFAFRSPLSRGAILADEVGLGKTIEAGLIISQLWAERKRRILIIVPTTLRKQWVQELADKFFLNAEVFDSKRYNDGVSSAVMNPFLSTEKIIVCSYNFARTAQAMIAATSWDLVVIDEAHRLRNVIKSGNKIARAIKDAIQNARGKVLLTATPLQNTLLELYALTGFLDEHLFGDLESFKAQYLRGTLGQRDFRELRERLRPVCQRTLRRQVAEYVRYTNRISITEDFTPSAAEQKLYDEVSEYLRRDEIYALPRSQRKLMILILRKLLASSTFAIAGTLGSLVTRLQTIRAGLVTNETELANDFETFPELSDEWAGDSEAQHEQPSDKPDVASLEAEIADLMQFRDLARSIDRNAKGEKLLQALRGGFSKLEELGANRRAVIFTESRRTQQYLWELLTANGYDSQVMTFNGTNTDAHSAEIYKAWKTRHDDEPTVTGRKDVDMRAALIEHFSMSASIMIATEAAAEGVNLQFCSLVVNYDLPWNPQRIEQRIGRCHRYGQKHDVVVINFLNRGNEADLRVFEILSEKFRLFNGVFGASDEVLGALESGVDFERRITEIYQSCRTPGEIDAAFNRLQAELSDQIEARMSTTRATLLEHFDEDVHARLNLHRKEAEARVGRFERWLWQLTSHELEGRAQFDNERHRFFLEERLPGFVEAPTGTYRLITRDGDANGFHPYRLGHPLAQEFARRARARGIGPAHVVFDYANHPTRITPVAALQGRSGWLSLTLVHIEAFEEEDHLVFSAMTDEDEVIDQEVCERLFDVAGCVSSTSSTDEIVPVGIQAQHARRKQALLSRLVERNTAFFEDEIEKLERWAEDLKRGLEQKVKDLDAEIRAIKKEARTAATLEAKLELHRRARDLETERGRRRRDLYEAQDDVERQKDELIAKVESRLQQRVSEEALFTIRWEVR